LKRTTRIVIGTDPPESLVKIEAKKRDVIALDELMKTLVAETNNSKSTAQAKLNADTIVYKGRRVFL
jgi:putative heme iron utilization protein